VWDTSGESLQLTHDGRQLFIEFSAYILRDDELRDIGLIALIRDVSSLRQPQVDRRASRLTPDQEEIRTQAALLKGANDAIFVTSLDGGITYWNNDLRTFIRIDYNSELRGLSSFVGASSWKRVGEIGLNYR